MKVTIIGLGAGDLNQLPLGVYKLLTSVDKVYLRTKEHPVVTALIAEGVQFESFDTIYESHDQFAEVYEEISTLLLEKGKVENIVYAVPGHPLVAEKTVQLLIERADEYEVTLDFKGGQSFLDSMFQALRVDPVEGFSLLDGTDLKGSELVLTQHMIIGQVYDAFIASEVKLTLMDYLPDDYLVKIVTAAGSSEEVIKEVPLYELDHDLALTNLTSVYVPAVTDEEILYPTFPKLKEIIATLRGPNGCPWDKKQTHQSLKKYLIEEAYELIEAIEEDDIDHMIEELGDVLLQVMLHAQIGEDEGYFSIHDIIDGLSKKMVFRHPHVFGEKAAEDVNEALRNWDEMKQQEKGEKTLSLLEGVPKSYPAILRAEELQKRAAKVGFDWENTQPMWDKVFEEIKEFQLEAENNNDNRIIEFGDIIFAFINIARYYQINPEEALNRTNTKFTNRFSYIEKNLGKNLEEASLEEMDRFWEEAKKKGY